MFPFEGIASLLCLEKAYISEVEKQVSSELSDKMYLYMPKYLP